MSEKRINFLQEKYPQISKEDFLTISACDTTTGKKYLDWLLKTYAGKKLDINNLTSVTEIIEIHNGLKDDVAVELRDINRFASVEDFMISFNRWLVKRFQDNENTIDYYKRGAELVFENDDIFIVKVLSYEGSTHFGSKTKWCTNQYNDYSRYAATGAGMYIVTTKSHKYRKAFYDKTQLSVSNLEFRNQNNDGIDLLRGVADNIELYKPFQKIFKGNNKITEVGLRDELRKFFDFSSMTSDVKKQLVTKYGFALISVIENFNYSMICDLFETFKDKVFQYIPDSDDKFSAFVSVVEDGLKIMLKKGYKISDDACLRAVESFPENITLVSIADDSLWRTAIRREAWLINVSPFFKEKNVKELVSMAIDNPATITFYDVEKIIPEEQRLKIAEELLHEFNDFVDIFIKLKIKNEEYQLKLVERNYNCLSALCQPTTVVTAKVKELKKAEKEAEEKRKADLVSAKEAERKRREAILKKDREKQKELDKLWGFKDEAIAVSDDMDWLTDFDESPKKSKPSKWGDVVRQFADGTYEIMTPQGTVVRAHSLEEARMIHSKGIKGQGWK